jgi:hypothetical protein
LFHFCQGKNLYAHLFQTISLQTSRPRHSFVTHKSRKIPPMKRMKEICLVWNFCNFSTLPSSVVPDRVLTVLVIRRLIPILSSKLHLKPTLGRHGRMQKTTNHFSYLNPMAIASFIVMCISRS